MITIKDSLWNVIKEIPADVNKTLLEQLTEAGIDIPAACYTGVCWACMCEIEKGSDKINKNFTWEDPDAEIILKTIY